MTKCFHLFLVALAVLFLLFPDKTASQTYTISGTVRDSSTNEPLAATNIRIDGTSKGTISNAEGQYSLSLAIGSYTLIFSYLSYETDSVRIVIDRDVNRDVYLIPTPILFPEVVVTDEDPAIRIMRQVIENKHVWVDALHSYELEAFTRQVLRRDTSIASISESYVTGFWQKGDTLREVVRQMRKTVNLPGSSGIASVGGIVNFYDDEVRIAGFRFVGPTALDAFDYYDFTLYGTRERNGIPFYTITVIPKSRLVPLFYGKLTIAGDSYALAGVEVTPNEAFTIPFLSEMQYSYAQQFMLYEGKFWMPVDIRITGWFSISIVGISFPRIGIEHLSSIYEYRINAAIPDSMLTQPRRLVTKDAEQFDSTYWAHNIVLPLTEEEQLAYQELDSTQTLSKQFRPSGPLMTVGEISNSPLGLFDFRFNRAEGFYLGAKTDVDSVSSSLRMWGGTGYGLSDKRWEYHLGAEYFIDSLRHWSVGAEYSRGIDHFPDEEFHSDLTYTFGALLGKKDDRDYYYRNGWRLFVTAKPFRYFLVKLNYRNEKHVSAYQTTNFSLFHRSDAYRPLPFAVEGTLQSLMVTMRYGQNNNLPVQLASTDFIEIEAEHASPSLLGGGFDFTRLFLRGEVSVQTYAKRLVFAPTLYARLSAGTSWRSLPTQRLFSPETQLGSFGFFGVLYTAYPREFIGDQFVMLSLEHNFRSTPFLGLDIPFLYRNSIELMVHGAAARTWNSLLPPGIPGYATNGWYYEAGVGLGRIFGLFRLDVTQRLSERNATFFSFGISRFF